MKLFIPKQLLLVFFLITAGIFPLHPGLAFGQGESTSASQPRVLGLNSKARIPGSYIVILDKDPKTELRPDKQRAVAADVAARVEDLALTYGGRVEHVYTSIIHGYAVSNLPESAAHAISELPTVEYVETDKRADLLSGGSQDIFLSGLWGLDRIDQTSGLLDSKYYYPNSGYGNYGHEAFVLDTGIDASHSGFEGRVDSGYNAVTETISGTNDCQGHGTHVAGIIGGSSSGVAKEARLRPIKITQQCTGNTDSSDVVEAVDWVSTERINQMWNAWYKAYTAVLNMSNTGGDDTASVVTALENLATDDTLRTVVVVAAGNKSSNHCQAGGGGTAGDSPYILNVGASYLDGTTDRRWGNSNYGGCVDLFAPGKSIRSTVISGGYATKSGTSMAAPFVAGAALLYIYDNDLATSSEVMNALLGSTLPGEVAHDQFGGPYYDLLNIEFMNN